MTVPVALLVAGCCKQGETGWTGPFDAGAFAVVAVDDDADPFREAKDPPGDLTLGRETVPSGAASEQRTYLRLERRGQETLDEALGRIRPWLEQQKLPAGRRLAWGPELASPPSDAITGWRSYLLEGPVVVDGADIRRVVENTDDMVGASLRVELNESGAKAFEALTIRHVKKRCAILVGGKVESAPVIQERIPGGNLLVTAGPGHSTRRLREALVGK